jgi:hypothetical protein
VISACSPHFFEETFISNHKPLGGYPENEIEGTLAATEKDAVFPNTPTMSTSLRFSP